MLPLKLQVSVLVVAHGSLNNPESSAPARRLVHTLRSTGRFQEVRAAFWREQASLREAWTQFSSEHVVVVPVFVADGYFVQKILPRELGLTGRLTQRDTRLIRYAEPLGTHFDMQDVVMARVEAARPFLTHPLEESALVLVGHGTRRSTTSSASVLLQVGLARQRGRFAEVDAVFLDQDPEIDTLWERVSAPQIIAVPYFVSDGFHTRDEIPQMLGLTSLRADTMADVIADDVRGRRVVYTSAVGTDDTLGDVAWARIQEALQWPWSDTFMAQEDGWLDQLTPVKRKDTLSRFKAWLTLHDTLEVGEVSLVRVGTPPFHQWRLTHHSDRSVAGEALATVDLAGLDRLARLDDAGEHRPLRWSRGLPRGWQITVGERDLVDVLETVYPGALAMGWGQLEVVPWSVTASRQTGTLKKLVDLDSSRVPELRVRCCDAMTCLRTPFWIEAKVGVEAVRDEDGKETQAAVPGVAVTTALTTSTVAALPCFEACGRALDIARDLVPDRPYVDLNEVDPDTLPPEVRAQLDDEVDTQEKSQGEEDPFGEDPFSLDFDRD